MMLASLYTQPAGSKGWGVFTSEALESGTVIEISPVIIMTGAEKLLLDQTTLYNYIFDWEAGMCCMAMGLVPVYNHGCPSNCEYFQEYDKGTIYIKTMRDILQHEELTINYNGDFNNTAPVWFEAAL
jgi:hypothetical protein